jgi:hypothetical protein
MIHDGHYSTWQPGFFHSLPFHQARWSQDFLILIRTVLETFKRKIGGGLANFLANNLLGLNLSLVQVSFPLEQLREPSDGR